MHYRSAREPLASQPLEVLSYDWLTVTTKVVHENLTHGGWLWIVLIWMGPPSGVITLSLADAAGRASNNWADPLYWVGISLIYLPAIARVLSGIQIGRSEALSAVLSVAFGFSLVRILEYPTGFALNDEFQHWRTLQDILTSGHLFTPNSILPVSPAFPGLEILTDALVKLSGLPVFVAAMCVIVVAKQLLTLALFLTFEHVGSSTRFAATATLIYLANPSVLYDDAQYSYEILGLALAVTSLYLLVRATTYHGAARATYIGLAIPTMAALTVTHHVSALLFIAFIVFWALIEPYFNNGLGSWRVPIVALIIMIPMLIGWYLVVANVVWWYLAPYPVLALRELISVIAGEGQPRTLFSHYGAPVPLWEQIASYAAVAITCVGLIAGWVFAARNFLLSGLARVFALAAMAYFAALGLHLVPAGLGGATRLMSWSIIPAAFVIALDVVMLVRAVQRTPRRASIRHAVPKRQSRLLMLRVTTVVACGVMLLGNISIDAGYTWHHTPGPYIVGGEERSISQESITSAQWMGQALGPGHRLATDFENSFLFATYGAQFPITPLTESFQPSVIFVAPEYDTQVQELIAAHHIKYLIVDLRLSTALPAQGFYFGTTELGGQLRKAPLSRAALLKFSSVVGIDLVYDSGNILIYKVE